MAGLFGRVDRLGVRVAVTLDTDRHMRNIAQCAIVEVQQNAILNHPRNKPHARKQRVIGRAYVLGVYPQQRRALFVRVLDQVIDVFGESIFH